MQPFEKTRLSDIQRAIQISYPHVYADGNLDTSTLK